MADNVAITSGSGTIVATDQVGTDHYQKIKLVDGTADSTNAAIVSAAGAVKVDGSAVTQPVSGTVTANAGTGPFPVSDNAGSLTVDGPLTDAELRASAVPVSAASLPLPTGAATAAKQPALGTAGVPSADVITVQGVASMTAVKVDGSAVTQPVSAASLPLPTGAATETTLAAVKTAVEILDNIVAGTEAQVDVVAPLPAGTNTIGKVGLDPQTAGGLTISRVISAATTNATSAKASAGQVYGWYLSNINAAVRYLKLYNKASAPTVGTDTPAMTIAIPGNTAGAGANVEFTNGIAFGTGIAYALTTGVADADTGAVAANEIVVNLLFK